MKKKAYNNRKSVLYNWVFSYIIILCSFIVTSIISYTMTENIIKKEIINSNNFILSQAQKNMDVVLENMQNLSMQIIFNDKIQRISKYSEPISDEQYYNISQAISDLKTYDISNPSIEGFYIYFNNINRVLTSNYFYDEKFYYNLFYQSDKFSFNNWHDIILKRNNGTLFLIPGQEQSIKKDVAYITSMPLPSINDVDANVVVLIDETKFIRDTAIINNTNKGKTFIIDNNDIIVTTSSSFVLPSDIKYKNMPNKTGMFYTNINGKKYILSYISSQFTKWKYVSLIPTSTFWRKAEYARNIFLISTSLCFVIGIILIYIFCKINYRPLSKLLKFISKGNQNNLDVEDNEYSYIENAILKTIDEKEEINKILDQQNKILKMNFLERLLNGKIQIGTDMNNTLKSYSINLFDKYYAVVLFYIDGLNDGISDINLNNYQTTIINIIQSKFETKYKTYTIDINDGIACIINDNENNKELFKENILELCEQTLHKSNEKYNIQLIFAISSILETAESIPILYNEAMQVMEYKRILNIKDIDFYDDIKVREGKYSYPIEKEQQLINYIGCGNYEDSSKVVKEIFDKNLNNNSFDIEITRCLVFNIISTTIRAVNNLNEIYEDEILKKINPIETITKCRNIKEMMTNIDDIIKNICIFINEKNKKQSNKFNKEIIHYIMQNYTDQNLNITMIAQKFKMHPVYVSKVFKQNVGVGLIDYINKLRINESKKLLKCNDKNLEDIANIVGYSNSRTFTREFKKYEGITPGKYREKL